jgi:hypothetical protein
MTSIRADLLFLIESELSQKGYYSRVSNKSSGMRMCD